MRTFIEKLLTSSKTTLMEKMKTRKSCRLSTRTLNSINLLRMRICHRTASISNRTQKTKNVHLRYRRITFSHQVIWWRADEVRRDSQWSCSSAGRTYNIHTPFYKKLISYYMPPSLNRRMEPTSELTGVQIQGAFLLCPIGSVQWLQLEIRAPGGDSVCKCERASERERWMFIDCQFIS